MPPARSPNHHHRPLSSLPDALTSHVHHPARDENHPHHPDSTKRPPTAAPPHPHFRIRGGAPQLIRVAGFRDVFERYYNRLEEATCRFGPQDQVDCRCDTLHGTIECDVPRTETASLNADDSVLVVKAQIAEFETPPLAFKYSTSSCDESANTLLRPAALGYDDSTNTSMSSPPPGQNNQTHTDDKPADDDGEKETAIAQTDKSNIHARILAILSPQQRSNPGRRYTLLHECIAELVGTMFIVIFGVGSVCSAVLLKKDVALWHIATVWGFGVALAILATASVSGAHLNPAVSLALAIFRPNDFPSSKILPYWLAQYLGGIIGGAFNLMIFGPAFTHFEETNNIIRGQLNENFTNSALNTARAFGEYFPAPGGALPDWVISPAFAMLVEAWGTGILMFMILALTDPRQRIIRSKEMLPFYIGFTVAVLITLYAPLTQAGWNPARDFGPRVVAALAGWGKVAIPGPRNGFWVYIVGPKIGAPIGALAYDRLIRPGLLN